MTKTTRDLRSARHTLRAAANALEETATTLRALSDDLNEPDPEPAAPEWPTAPLVWHDGEVWTRDEDGDYTSATDTWADRYLQSPTPNLRQGARMFALEAVPVTVVPTREWEAWHRATAHREWNRAEAELMNATDTLAGW